MKRGDSAGGRRRDAGSGSERGRERGLRWIFGERERERGLGIVSGCANG